MKQEFNLSEKINGFDLIASADVKEFIKKLKQKINGLDFFMSGSKIRFDDWLKEEIDKLAGKDLI